MQGIAVALRIGAVVKMSRPTQGHDCARTASPRLKLRFLGPQVSTFGHTSHRFWEQMPPLRMRMQPYPPHRSHPGIPADLANSCTPATQIPDACMAATRYMHTVQTFPLCDWCV